MIGVQAGTKVTNLRRGGAANAVQLAIDDEAAADARADRDVEHAIGQATRAVSSLGSARHIASVANDGGQPEWLLAPGDEGEVIPAGDLMAFERFPCARINRPAE